MRFFSLADANRQYYETVSIRHLPLILSSGSFPGLRWFPHMCMLISVLLIFERDPLQISSFFSEQLTPFWCSILWILAMLIFAGVQQFLQLREFATLYLGSYSACHCLEALSIGELTPTVFHLRITVFHCLMPASWELFFHILCLVFGSLEWESKSNFCCSILARSRSAKEVLRNCPTSRQPSL